MDWHPYAEKFPLMEGEPWEAFKASILASQGNDTPIITRRVDGKLQGIDGRNRFRACEELGIEPKVVVVNLKDEEVRGYILRRNLHRRHLAPEVRAALAQELREEGLKVEEIAQELGASRATIYRDLAPPAEPTPPEEWVFCEECLRCGPTAGCSECAALNHQPPPPQEKPEPRVIDLKRPELKPADLAVPPPTWPPPVSSDGAKTFSWIHLMGAFGTCRRAVDNLARDAGKMDCPEAKALRKELDLWLTILATYAQQWTGQELPRDVQAIVESSGRTKPEQ